MENRIQRLVQALPDEFEAAIITSDVNRYYFLGMRSSAGTLVVLKDKAYFIVDFRYIELAQRTVKNAEVILQGKLYEQVKEILTKHNVKTVWMEDSLSLGSYNAFQKALDNVKICLASPLTKEIEALRAIKTKKELEYIQTAQKFTDAGFKRICEILAPGKKERDMAVELEYFMKQEGAEELAFNTILVSGKNSSLPHGVPSDKIIEKGDFVTMDFGSKFGGYCTDMTRTVAIGSVTDEMKHVYDTVLTAQLKALDMIKEGVICCDVDKVARDYIYQNGYEGRFGHSLGHSVGIEIHEKPGFAATVKEVVKEGMVMTVEPGIYLPEKFGVRIEDTIYVTKTGHINVAKSPKELIIL